ncbi:MAG: Tim44 domain-containing protein [Rhodobacteraceae bacterium]|nr:MAG: Tim44 domain-containing protein [Paracoccaceae bacterium]
MPSGVIELIILAGIAVFLLFRLRGVLGTKTGFEEQQHRPIPRAEATRPAAPPPAPLPDEGVDEDSAAAAGGDTEIAEALAAMRRAEEGFSPRAFVQGARGAYEMILMAFEQGDLDTLRRFLAPDVYAGFAEAIEGRRAAGYTVEARFIGVREAKIVGARFDPETADAEIAIRFKGEMITAVHDAEHRVIEGDPNEIRRETDVWTFARRMGASDPNWLLVATGE